MEPASQAVKVTQIQVIPFSERQKKSVVKLVVNEWRERWRRKISRRTVPFFFRIPNTAEGYQDAVQAFYQMPRNQSPKPHQEVYEKILKTFSLALAWLFWSERFRSLESKQSEAVWFHLEKVLSLKVGQAISGARTVGTYGELADDLNDSVACRPFPHWS